MAHMVYGVDVGAWSVKVAVLDVGFRHSRLLDVQEERVLPGDKPLADRQRDAVRAALQRVPPEASVYFAMPGESIAIRNLLLPFSEARKIEQVIGYELEGQILHPLEEVVFDHMVVRTSADGSTVMAVAARREDVGAYLELARAAGIEPRALFAAPIVYRAVAPPELPLPPAVDGSAPQETCQVVLDLGHLRTNVAILRGREVIYARTVLRGGQHLTAAIAKAFECGYDQAEQGKLQEAMITGPGRPATTPIQTRLDAVLREALQPLIRELRQTLASFQGAIRLPVDRVYLTGGTARLAGLAEFLAAEFSLAVQTLGIPTPGASLDNEHGETVPAIAGTHALALGIAWSAARGKKDIDLRRGPFVYRASFSVLRQKALHVAALAAMLILAFSVDTWARLTSLRREQVELDARLKSATSELFGEAKSDAKAVTSLLNKGAKEELAPIPKATAFDLLDTISKKVPAADKVKLDVLELDIKPKKTFIKATVDSAAAVDEIVARLREMDCFEEVTPGSITEVSGGAKQFSLSIASKCP